MSTALRGIVLGMGYGLAVAVVEGWLLVLRLWTMGLPPVTKLSALAAVVHILFGVAVGLLASPLLRLRRGWLWHLLALAAIWFAVGNITSPKSDFLFIMVAGPPLAGLLLALGGHFLARHRRWLPGAIGAVALLGGLGFSEARMLATSRASSSLASRPAAAAGSPDVVLIVLDTVRAESQSAYGYARSTSPTFDALAGDGAVFLQATSPSTWSLPSHASLFTGLYASVHGAHNENRHLRDGFPTLAETLADAGYETACFTANPWISDALGTARGFDYSDEAWRSGGAGRSMNGVFRALDYLGFGAQDKGGSDVVSNFERWMASRPDSGRPMFVFMNFIEAHFPYHQLPRDYLQKYTSRERSELLAISLQLLADQFGDSDLDPAAALEPARDMYDGGILYADHLLGRVAEALRSRGTLDSTIFVVLADHGELVGEHGVFGHGRSLHEPGIRVPLLVRYPPRVPAARVATPVSTVGVKATILDLVNVAPQRALHVGSLLPVIEGRLGGGPVVSERFAREDVPAPDERAILRNDVRHFSYRADDWKLIETSSGDRFLFDLASDPGETRNLADRRPEELARMLGEVETWRAAIGLPALDAPLDTASSAPELDEAARERLRALGYVE